MELLAPLVSLELPEKMVSAEHLDFKELLVFLVSLVPLALLDPPDSAVAQDPSDQPDPLADQALQAPLELQVYPVQLDPLAVLAPKVPLDLLDPLDPKV